MLASWCILENNPWKHKRKVSMQRNKKWKISMTIYLFCFISYGKPKCGLYWPNTTEHNGDAFQYFLSRCLSNGIVSTTAKKCISMDRWQQVVRSTSKLCRFDEVFDLAREYTNKKIDQSLVFSILVNNQYINEWPISVMFKLKKMRFVTQ